MQAVRREAENVLPFDSREHPRTSIAFMRPYALRMHFFGSSKKSIKSRDERTSKKPYALYAPLLGVGVFSAFFLLREVHTAAYGSHRNQALALLPVGIGAFPACENQKCIRIRIRISADSRRNRPSMKSIRLRPSSSPADAQAVFAPKNDSLAPLTGFRPFGG